MTLIQEVTLELKEMQKLGVTVPAAAFLEAENAAEYENMHVSEIASLCLELST